ncbi:MAG TPA: hypothetical protein VK453_25325 [Micromonosporaceae bacterium]|nr:hypothetical protein [Micromonosporaceae bacterium]
MALLTAVVLGNTATLSAPANVANGDRISGGDIANGAILEVHNGSGGSITVTIVDPGTTAAGNATVSPQTAGLFTVAAGATKRIKPSSVFVSNATAEAVVNYSSPTSVTYELYR